MIVVSGTRRSGTSMWMQVLRAAGIPILGSPFPRHWDRTALVEANPKGFYETLYREGIHHNTNPHPVTGQYLRPAQLRGYAVKIFASGVVRSERAYMGHLIANVRPWRDYVTSMERLYALELRARGAPSGAAPPPFPFAYEWWRDNYSLVSDIAIRRYPARLYAYEAVLADPERVVTEVLRWVKRGSAAEAVAAVDRRPRTQRWTSQHVEVDPKHAQMFDDIYTAVMEKRGIQAPLLRRLKDFNREIAPLLHRFVIEAKKRNPEMIGYSDPLRREPVEGLPPSRQRRRTFSGL